MRTQASAHLLLPNNIKYEFKNTTQNAYHPLRTPKTEQNCLVQSYSAVQKNVATLLSHGGICGLCERKIRRALYRIPLPLPCTALFRVQHKIALTNNTLAVNRKMRKCMSVGNCCYAVQATNMRKLKAKKNCSDCTVSLFSKSGLLRRVVGSLLCGIIYLAAVVGSLLCAVSGIIYLAA